MAGAAEPREAGAAALRSARGRRYGPAGSPPGARRRGPRTSARARRPSAPSRRASAATASAYSGDPHTFSGAGALPNPGRSRATASMPAGGEHGVEVLVVPPPSVQGEDPGRPRRRSDCPNRRAPAKDVSIAKKPNVSFAELPEPHPARRARRPEPERRYPPGTVSCHGVDRGSDRATSRDACWPDATPSNGRRSRPRRDPCASWRQPARARRGCSRGASPGE